MSMQLATLIAASACGLVGALAYVYAHVLRRGPFRPFHIVALCLNLLALGQVAFAAMRPHTHSSLALAAGCIGAAILAMSLSALQQRRLTET